MSYAPLVPPVVPLRVGQGVGGGLLVPLQLGGELHLPLPVLVGARLLRLLLHNQINIGLLRVVVLLPPLLLLLLLLMVAVVMRLPASSWLLLLVLASTWR
jgi:hypothetical protein